MTKAVFTPREEVKIKAHSHRAKTEVKAKFSLMSVVYSLIFFASSLIIFAFTPAFSLCESPLSVDDLDWSWTHLIFDGSIKTGIDSDADI